MLQMSGDVFTLYGEEYPNVVFRVTAQFISILDKDDDWINLPIGTIRQIVTHGRDISLIRTRPHHVQPSNPDDEIPF